MEQQCESICNAKQQHSTTVFIDVERSYTFSIDSHKTENTPILHDVRFQISRTRNCDRGPPKHDFWARPASYRIFSDLPDPRHGAWCTTPGTLAPEVRMTVVLNKLPQIKITSGGRLVAEAQISMEGDWLAYCPILWGIAKSDAKVCCP